jgi:hypothetical protein
LRLLEGDIAAKLLSGILAQPRVKRLLSTTHFSVDGTLIEAWASMKSSSLNAVMTNRQPSMKDERKESAVAFLAAATAHFASLGVKVERVMTDNGSCYVSQAFHHACHRLGLEHIRTGPYTFRTTDVIDKCFLAGSELFSSRAWVTARRRAGPEAQALPRSPLNVALGCGACAHPLGTTRIPTGDEARVGRLGLLDPSALLSTRRRRARQTLEPAFSLRLRCPAWDEALAQMELRKASPVAMIAQTIRASLLAKATTTTLAGLRALSAANQSNNAPLRSR